MCVIFSLLFACVKNESDDRNPRSSEAEDQSKIQQTKIHITIYFFYLILLLTSWFGLAAQIRNNIMKVCSKLWLLNWRSIITRDLTIILVKYQYTYQVSVYWYLDLVFWFSNTDTDTSYFNNVLKYWYFSIIFLISKLHIFWEGHKFCEIFT